MGLKFVSIVLMVFLPVVKIRPIMGLKYENWGGTDGMDQVKIRPIMGLKYQ